MTLAELRNHLLRQLGVLGVGRAASAEDAFYAEDVLTRAHAELEMQGVVAWTLDDTPDYAVEGVTMYAMPMAARAFGLTDVDPLTQRMGINHLRTVMVDREANTAKAVYF